MSPFREWCREVERSINLHRSLLIGLAVCCFIGFGSDGCHQFIINNRISELEKEVKELKAKLHEVCD